jgi:hypothetical protein
MRSAVWRVGGGARNRVLSAAGRVSGRLGLCRAAVVLVAMAVDGCGHHYAEPGDAGFDAAGATAPAKARASAKAKIPLPSRALLARQAEPKCEDIKSIAAGEEPAKGEGKREAGTQTADASAAAAPAADQSAAAAAAAPAPGPGMGDPNASLALRIKLEYERECYRQAELRVRERLHRLQSSVGATIKAMEAQLR